MPSFPVYNRPQRTALKTGISIFIVEVIDDADAAYEIVSKLCCGSKDVVSASKKMIAEHLFLISFSSRKNRSVFLYERQLPALHSCYPEPGRIL